MFELRRVLDLFDEKKEFYEEKVSQGIETYRKGNGRITVKDKNGNTVKNAKIRLKQKSHEFKFGASLFLLDEMESEEKNKKYKECFSSLCNMATIPFYWNALEPEKGKLRYEKDSAKIYRRPSVDLCIEFCERYGIEPREHALAYDHFYPKWLYEASVDEVKAESERRFAEISERYADKINTIEVTNEQLSNNPRTAMYKEPDCIEWYFDLARKNFPNNQLVINEDLPNSWDGSAEETDGYFKEVNRAIVNGARIDAIGMQYHLFFDREKIYEKTRKVLDPEHIYKIMDLYARFGKPIQVTEVTIPSYSWAAEDEDAQAEIIEKMYSVWFSHPNTEQIIYWNLVDGYAHVPNPDPEAIRLSQGNMRLGENYYHGGLLRFDLSPKPAYYKLKGMIEKRWHTETESKTDSNGIACFRGFFGAYEAEVYVDEKRTKKEIVLSKKSDNEFNITI